MTTDARELKLLDEALWIAETDFKMFGVNIGNRMTMMRTQAGKLIIHSPVRAETPFFDTITGLGEPLCLISPNLFHHLHLTAWRKHYPAAPVLAPPSQTNIPFDRALENGPLADTDDDIVAVAIGGSARLSEFALIHLSSRTLILTDLAFNFRQLPGLWSPLVARVYGAYGHFGPSRLVKALVRDRAAFKASLNQLMAFDFDRIIVSHGDVVTANGKTVFATAFADFL